MTANSWLSLFLETCVETGIVQGAFAEGLGERERKIMNERVLAQEQRTLQELGDELGITRERVRQLEKGLVDGLRDYLKEHVVDFEVYAPSED